MARVIKARELVEKREATGIRHALEKLKGGDDTSHVASEGSRQLAITAEDLQQLLQAAMATALAPVLAERDELRTRVGRLEDAINALPAPQTEEVLARLNTIEAKIQQQPVPVTHEQVQEATLRIVQAAVQPMQADLQVLVQKSNTPAMPVKRSWLTRLLRRG